MASVEWLHQLSWSDIIADEYMATTGSITMRVVKYRAETDWFWAMGAPGFSAESSRGFATLEEAKAAVERIASRVVEES